MSSRLASAALSLSIACATAPLVVTASDEASQLRAQLALADDDVVRAGLRDALSEVELKRAREANTVYAYRHFLQEFPAGPDATAARVLLETLRFDVAKKANTRAGWESFLEDHPNGRRASDARDALGALEIDFGLKSSDRLTVQRILARFPEHARRSELVAHEDRLAYVAARKGGLDALETYLLEHPQGAHRNDASAARAALETEVLVASEDLARLRQRVLAADAPAEIRAALVSLELRQARRDFDREWLGRIANDPDRSDATRSLRDEARGLVESLGRIPPAPQVSAAIDRARPGHGLRPIPELVELLRTADPLDRVELLGELPERADPAAIDVLLDALDSRYVAVRLAAIDRLRELSQVLPSAVWQSIARAREQEALLRALSAGPWRRIAALRDVQGRDRDALEAWREVLRAEPDDLAARARVLHLERRGTDKLSIGAAARELARTVGAFGDDRWLQPQDGGIPPEARRDGPGVVVGLPAGLTVVRQLCSAIDLGEEARRTLASLRIGASTSEQELYGLGLGDLEKLLNRLSSRRQELEREVRARTAAWVACGTDRLTPRIEALRTERVSAIELLGASGDRRVLEFVVGLERSPSDRIRAAATKAAALLASAPPEPPAPVPPPSPARKPARRR